MNKVCLGLILLFCVQSIFAESTSTQDFFDNGDGTVTHKKTGLTWMRCRMGEKWTGITCEGKSSDYTWNEAMLLKTTFAGQSDWRLPNQDELFYYSRREAVSSN